MFDDVDFDRLAALRWNDPDAPRNACLQASLEGPLRLMLRRFTRLSGEEQAGATLTLSPEPDEDWLETFPALDLEGQVITGREDAYYSWFSTAGDFGFETTRPPGRDTEWTAPMEPGEVPFWLVVRDGHLGTSACLGMIRVE